MEKTKSISSFILGLISTLGCGVWAYYTLAIGILFSFNAEMVNVFFIAFFALIACIIVSIVALVFCFFKSKISGILFSVCSLVNILIVVVLGIIAGNILAFWVNIILVVTFAICAIIAFVSARKQLEPPTQEQLENKLSDENNNLKSE